MTGRPSVNKRQREMLRKERQAEKATRRDERRVKRNLGEGEQPLAPELAEADGTTEAAGTTNGAGTTDAIGATEPLGPVKRDATSDSS